MKSDLSVYSPLVLDNSFLHAFWMESTEASFQERGMYILDTDVSEFIAMV